VGEDITLEVSRHGGGHVRLEFSPALSLRAKVLDADVNGSKASPKISANANDQHALLSVPIAADKTTIHLRVTGNFGIANPYSAPADGAVSSNLRIVSETWSAAHDQLQLQLEGISGATYELPVFNVPTRFQSDGALLEERPSGKVLVIQFRKGPPGQYLPLTLTLNFPAQ